MTYNYTVSSLLLVLILFFTNKAHLFVLKESDFLHAAGPIPVLEIPDFVITFDSCYGTLLEHQVILFTESCAYHFVQKHVNYKILYDPTSLSRLAVVFPMVQQTPSFQLPNLPFFPSKRLLQSKHVMTLNRLLHWSVNVTVSDPISMSEARFVWPDSTDWQKERKIWTLSGKKCIGTIGLPVYSWISMPLALNDASPMAKQVPVLYGVQVADCSPGKNQIRIVPIIGRLRDWLHSLMAEF